MCSPSYFVHATKYGLNHSITLSGISAETFNTKATIKRSFSDTVKSLLINSGVKDHEIPFMHACNFGSVPSIHVCLNEECDDNYIICLESKGNKHRRTLLNKNIEVDVHYQVTNLFQETALEVFQEMQNGRFHETTVFLPFVSSVKKEIIKTIANMDGDKSIGNLSTNATATPSNNPQLISCDFTSYCSHGIALSRFLQTTTRSK